jgi:hypothetical protein
LGLSFLWLAWQTRSEPQHDFGALGLVLWDLPRALQIHSSGWPL